ncbi:MAG: hypothetical protein KGZ58_05450 [Ignavibacteriales bacterium]|nr:hypothetical protein [Ignavibacteriales bacterium]
MNLKTEQLLDNFSFTEKEPRLYSTGVHLVPLEIEKENGKRFVWVVDEFDDETYDGNGDLITPREYADSVERLIQKEEK